MSKTKNSSKLNYIYSMSYSVLNMILPLITSPYISRVMGAERLGVYSYTHSIANYFILFAMLGFNNYGNRCIAKVRDDQDSLNRTFSSIYVMQAITSVSMLCLYVLYILFFVKEYKNIFIIQILIVFGNLLSVNWFYWGLEEFKLTVTKNFVIKILTFISTMVFVKSKEDLWIYTLVLSLSLVLNEGVLFIMLKKYVRLVKPSWNEIIMHLKPSVILFVPVLAVSIYRTMDKIMIKGLSEYAQVGYYTNAEKIINLCLSFVTALGQVMLPKMANILSKGRIQDFKQLLVKSMKFASFLSCAMTFGIIAVCDTFVPIFFGTGYEPCIAILAFLAPNLIFLAWGNVLKMQYLVPKEEDHVFIKACFWGAIVNVVINFILIPYAEALGAVIGTLCAEVISLMYILFSIKKEIDIKSLVIDSVPYAIIGLIMLAGVTLVKRIFDSDIFGLLIQIVIGAGIYGGITLGFWIITKEELWEEIKRFLKKRV